MATGQASSTVSDWKVVEPNDWQNVDTPSAVPNFTSNEKNEGLYEMQGPNGTQKIPYSKVPDAIRSGYHLSSDALKQYGKDRHSQNKQGSPGFHPLDELAAWGAKKAPYVSPEDAAKSGDPAPRILQNFGNTTFRDLTAIPAGVVGAVTNASWTPEQYQKKQQEQTQEGTVVDAEHPMKISGSDVSDYAADTAGGLSAGLLAGEAGGGLLKAPEAVAKFVGPGTRSVTELAEKTRAENAAAAASTAEVNANQAAKDKAAKIDTLRSNKEDAAAHATKKADVEAANREALRAQEKIAPTQEKLQSANEEMRARVETAREKALKEGNEKYTTVREALNNLPGDNEQITNAYGEALHSLGEAGKVSPILNRLEKILQEPITYKDEQLLYSELGTELSKGTLPGATYHAYDVIHEALGKDMYRIADSKGMGETLKGAQDYWRRMKQTFGKPLSMTDAATAAVRGADSEFLASEAQANRLRLLGSFDPEIPKVAQHIDNLQKGVKALGEQKPVREVVKVPPTKPTPEAIPKSTTPMQAETKTVGPAEVKEAKAQTLKETGRKIHNRLMWAAATPTLIAIGDVVRGHGLGLGGVAETGAATAGFVGLANLTSRLFDNPNFVDFMTKATPADIAAIPPDVRGAFPDVVAAANARGIKVSPAMIGMLALPKSKQLQAKRDAQRTAAQ